MVFSFFFQYRYFLAEAYRLYDQVSDESSRRLLGCSIKNKTVALKAYTDLDAPSELSASNLAYVRGVADREWATFKANSALFDLECHPLDEYWHELTDGSGNDSRILSLDGE